MDFPSVVQNGWRAVGFGGWLCLVSCAGGATSPASPAEEGTGTATSARAPSPSSGGSDAPAAGSPLPGAESPPLAEKASAQAEDRLSEKDLVLIECSISVEGVPTRCVIKKGELENGMNEAVLAMVRAQRFKPAMFEGRPRAVRVVFPIRVKMKKR